MSAGGVAPTAAPPAAKTIAFGAALGWLATAVTLLTGLLVTPLLIHRLGPSQYGFWGLLQACAAYFALGDLGAAHALAHLLARLRASGEFQERASILSTAFRFYLALSLAGVLVGLSSTLIPVVRAQGASATLSVALLSFGAATSLAMAPAVSTLIASRQLAVVHKSRSFASLAYLSGVLLSVRLELGLAGVAGAFLCAQFLAAVVVARAVPVEDRPGFVWAAGFSRLAARRLLRLGSLYFLTTLGWQLIVGTDSLVIASVLGLASVARYIPSFRLAELVHQGAFVALGTLQPFLAEAAGAGRVSRSAQLHLWAVRACGIAAGTSVCGSLLFGPTILLLWVGEPGYPGFAVLSILALFMAARVISYASGAVLGGLGRMETMGVATLVEGLINLALSLFLVRRLGLTGVAVGSLLAHLGVSAWLLPLTACRQTHTPMRQYLLALAGRPVMVTLAMAAASTVLYVLVPRPFSPLGLLLSAIAFLLTSVISIWVLGISVAERKAALGAWSAHAGLRAARG